MTKEIIEEIESHELDLNDGHGLVVCGDGLADIDGELIVTDVERDQLLMLQLTSQLH